MCAPVYVLRMWEERRKPRISREHVRLICCPILHRIPLQGTNAHVVLAALAPPTGTAVAPLAPDGSRLLWRPARHWVLPHQHPLLSTASVQLLRPSSRRARALAPGFAPPSVAPGGVGVAPVVARALRYAVRLDAPRASYLRDHIVSGRAICPAAALLEVVAAGVRAALLAWAPTQQQAQQWGEDAAWGGGSPQPALTGVEIPSPLLLPAAGGGGSGGSSGLELMVEVRMFEWG
jgi:hypothetical protein